MKNVAKKLVIARLNIKVKKLLSIHDITIVAVTGSIGKTSTKHAIGQVLGATRKVRYSQDSYNTDIGIPLSLFGLKVPAKLWNVGSWKKIFSAIDTEIANYGYDTVVLEMADDELTMMRKVLQIIHPDISVITAVAPVHMLALKDMKTVVHNNWQIAASAKTIVYNADNQALRKKAFKTGTVGFGMSYGTVRFGKISRSKSGYLKAEIHVGKYKKVVQTHMLGRQNLYSLLAAATVAHELDIPFSAICFELTQVKSVAGRMNLLEGINTTRIIDDSYNASPDAVVAALDTLAEFKGRKIAVLGSMNELGAEAITEHQKVGAYAAKVVDMLVTVGKQADEYLAPAATHAGLKPEQVKVFHTPYEAGHYLKNILQKGDTVLIKGSQDGVYTEEVARIILSDKLDSNEQLVRQSAVWKRRKKKSFAL